MALHKINDVKDGTILEVNVKPHSKEFKVTVEDNEIIISCKENPVKGKVNKELVKGLSKLFHSEVEIISGFTSKKKRLLVRHLRKSDIEKILMSK